MKLVVLFTMLVVAILAAISANTYVQHFNQDSNNTATSGWFFQTTLNLDEYKNVSRGNNFWGTFDRYTRSDRMGPNDVLTIYCNKYCKE